MKSGEWWGVVDEDSVGADGELTQSPEVWRLVSETSTPSRVDEQQVPVNIRLAKGWLVNIIDQLGVFDRLLVEHYRPIGFL